MLATSIFSFSRNVFNRPFPKGRQKSLLCGTGCRLQPPFLQDVTKRRLKTLWEKEKIMVTSIFSFLRNVFNRPFPLGRQRSFSCDTGCSLQPRVLQDVTRKRLKTSWEKEKMLASIFSLGRQPAIQG